jgi:hypothetical protein
MSIFNICTIVVKIFLTIFSIILTELYILKFFSVLIVRETVLKMRYIYVIYERMDYYY